MTKLFLEPTVKEVTVNSILRVDTENLTTVEELKNWNYEIIDSFENTYYIMPTSKKETVYTAYSFVKLAENYRSYEAVKNDDKITMVVNYDFDNPLVKEYKIPKSFGENTVELFDNRIDQVKEDLETCIFFLEGYAVFTAEQLQLLYKWLYQ